MINQLSVFFPLYNEEENAKSTVDKAIKVLSGLKLKNYEIILVNDGSKDKTAQVIDKIQKENSHIKLVTHNPNRGYGGALQSGLYTAKYPWIVFTDADGQFDFSEINKFIEEQSQNNADLVIGYYLDRKVGFLTKLTSKIAWELPVFILFGLHVKDTDCAFKLISKKVIDSIPHLESQRGAFISSELLIKANNKSFKIAEVGIHHFARAGGSGTGRKLNVIMKSYQDLIRLWWKMKNSSVDFSCGA